MQRAVEPPTQTPGSSFDAYRGTIRRQWLIVVLVAGAALVAALLWTSISSPDYKATATLLATPLPATNESFIGIDVLRESADETRTMQTAAALLDTRAAADSTAVALGSGWTVQDVQDNVSVKPEGQTNIVGVTATDDSASGAARLANIYVSAALELRRERLREQAATVIDDVRRQLSALPAGSGAAAELQARLPQLAAVRTGTDPTLALGQIASPPDRASGTPVAITILIALLLGLIVGTGVAVWADSSRRRGATEDELLTTYPVPLLAHIPPVRRRSGGGPAEPTPQAAEAYRSVLAQLHRRDRSTLLVTSACNDDGKTQVAVGLAMMAAAAGLRVALVALDLRYPQIGDLLSIPDEARADVAQLDRPGSGEDALIEVPSTPGLAVLVFRDEPLTSLGLEVGLRNAAAVLPEISQSVDVVVIDTAPLGEVSDALRIVQHADEVIVVVRPDHTPLATFAHMRDLLERAGHGASGMVAIGGIQDRAGAPPPAWRTPAVRGRTGGATRTP